MKRSFSVDARLLLSLGRNNIQDSATAVLELVKNCYDAGATRVLVIVDGSTRAGQIVVIDNGSGMSVQDINDYWLRIGFSKKRTTSTQGSRQVVGEKGIGRLSADRLGAELTLHTREEGGSVHGIYVNWNDFDVDERDISDIEVNVLSGAEALPLEARRYLTNHGTALHITSLREPWTQDDVHNLYEELSLLVAPFGGQTDFSVELRTDVDPSLNGEVQSPAFEDATIDLRAHFRNGQLSYKIAIPEETVQNAGEGLLPLSGSISWEQAVQRMNRGSDVDVGSSPQFGPAVFRFMFYPRTTELSSRTHMTMKELRTFLNQHHGVKIYRDNIRVKPYGFADDGQSDWLGLAERKTRNPAGPGRQDFRLSHNQIVGAVFISKEDNPNLVDTTSREGLLDNVAFRQLRACSLLCVQLIESQYHRMFRERSDSKGSQQRKKSPVESAKALSKQLSDFHRELGELSTSLAGVEDLEPEMRRDIDRTTSAVHVVSEGIDENVQTIEELVQRATVFRSLATVGIASNIFAHETQTAINMLSQTLSNAQKYLDLDPPEVSRSKQQIAKSMDSSTQVRRWGQFALNRVKRDKRRRKMTDLSSLVQGLLNEFGPTFSAAGVTLATDLQEHRFRAFPMDVESIVINLLTNAYAACQQVSSDRTVFVGTGPERRDNQSGACIIVADNGPGVAQEFVEKIWEPLFTTRRSDSGAFIGTGLGLYVVKSIVEDLEGFAEVTKDEELGGARFEIWIPG
jgi:signal transduction histidine kinase/anti-sigma regulatory factor (Ser/Thr protein kinase)